MVWEERDETPVHAQLSHKVESERDQKSNRNSEEKGLVSAEGTVLVCWGCGNNVPQIGGLNQQKLFSRSSGSCRYEIKVSAGLVSSEASLFDL